MLLENYSMHVNLEIVKASVCAGLCLVTQLCLTLCDPTDCSPPGFSVYGDSPDKNTEVGCILISICYFLFFDRSHPSRCEVVSLGLMCISLMTTDVEHLFLYGW